LGNSSFGGAADVAEELRKAEAGLPTRAAAKLAADKVVREREKTLKTYCTERTKTSMAPYSWAAANYEASHLKGDYDKLTYGDADVLDAADLRALQDLVRLSAPPPSLVPVALGDARGFVEMARNLAEVSIGLVVLEELERHPSMVPWIK
jgi:hypothetical protein